MVGERLEWVCAFLQLPSGFPVSYPEETSATSWPISALGLLASFLHQQPSVPGRAVFVLEAALVSGL